MKSRDRKLEKLRPRSLGKDNIDKEGHILVGQILNWEMRGNRFK